MIPKNVVGICFLHKARNPFLGIRRVVEDRLLNFSERILVAFYDRDANAKDFLQPYSGSKLCSLCCIRPFRLL